MVFVLSLISIALCILAGIIVLSIVFVPGFNVTKKHVEKEFLNYVKKLKFLNILYCGIIGWFLSHGTFFYTVSALLLTFLFTYTQKYVWSLWVYVKFFALSKFNKIEVVSETLTSTFKVNFAFIKSYIIAAFRATADEVGEFFRLSILDIKVALFLVEPTYKLTQAQKDLYELQCKFFKYKKVEDFLTDIESKSDEEVLKMYEALKKRLDPSYSLNRFRRLPWKFNHKIEDNFYFKLAVSNILVFYNFFKTTLVSVLLMSIYFLYTIFFFKIQFLKQLSVWFVIGMIYFWLMSGFNFFLKRYQYGKFTASIQRFWKRTNTYFWLIEGFLLLLFFYYYLNSSQEPLYMYDYSAINQEYLVSLHTAGLNIILLSIVIYFMYFALLRINSNSWTQMNLYLIIISSFIFFSFFIETYQFYYVISVFNERLWVFNEEENLWVIDIDNPILRTKHQYLLVCLIAKYWHFLFIFLSWVFFLIKSFERKKVTYVLFGANLQNMIILYVLNFACYLQWFKWIYRRFFDLPYTWFFVNIDNKFFFRLFFEVKLLLTNLYTFNVTVVSLQNVVFKSLVLWNVDSLCMWKFI